MDSIGSQKPLLLNNSADRPGVVSGKPDEQGITDEFVPGSASAEPQHKGNRLVAAFTKYVLGIRMPSAEKRPFTDEQIEQLIAKLEPGDVLVSSSDNYPNWKILEKLTINSDFTHAAIYEGDGKYLEATEPKVIRSDLRECLKGKKQFEVIRPPYKSKEDVKAALDYARSQLGKPYETELDFETDKELGCSELVQRALKAMPNPIDVATTKVVGKKIVAPDAFKDIEGAETIFTNRRSFLSMLVGKQYPVILSSIAGGVLGAVTMGPLGLVAGVVGGGLLTAAIGNKIEAGFFGLYED